MSYLRTVYGLFNTNNKKYPDALCNYLIDRYNIKKNSNILDVGCGYKYFMNAFNRSGMVCVGVDREVFDNNTCCIKDFEIEKLPFEDNTFDVLFSKSVIEHMYNPDNFIKECKRVLKPNGQLIILTPDWISQQDVFYEDYTHVHPYTKTSINDMLKAYGFDDVESEVFYQLPILWRYKYLKLVSMVLQLLLKPKLKRHKNKFIRWSIELMILGRGLKNV